MQQGKWPTVRVTKELKADLDGMSKKFGMPQSKLLGLALQRFVDGVKKDGLKMDYAGPEKTEVPKVLSSSAGANVHAVESGSRKCRSGGVEMQEQVS